MKRTITKHFGTIDAAEEYHESLCDEYDSVQLIRSPLFSEAGTYVWEVRQ
jgi:hypothetical protein